MPKLSEQASQARHDQIVDAAMRCFCRQGYQHTTMRDIFDESGLSAGAVYNYFARKEDIVAAVAERDQQRSRDAMGAQAQARTPPVALFRQLVSQFFGELRQAQQDGRAKMAISILAEAAISEDLAGVLLPYRQEMGHEVTGFVDRYLATAMPGVQVDPEIFATMLLAVYEGLLLRAATGEQVDFEAVAALLQRLVIER